MRHSVEARVDQQSLLHRGIAPRSLSAKDGDLAMIHKTLAAMPKTNTIIACDGLAIECQE